MLSLSSHPEASCELFPEKSRLTFHQCLLAQGRRSDGSISILYVNCASSAAGA